MPSLMPKRESNARRFTPPKLRFILDANISKTVIPQICVLFAFDIVHVNELTDKIISDEDIITIAKKQGRIIISHDLDYGEIYYLKERGKIGVIMLRLKDQTTKNVINKLILFFSTDYAEKVNPSQSLVIISENAVRLVSP